MIKNIVFDMGNVLLSWDPEYLSSKIAPDPQTAAVLLKEIFRSPDWVKLDAGTITENGLAEEICARLPEDMHAAIRHCLDVYDVYPPVLEHVQYMLSDLYSSGYKLYVLSNASHRWRRRLEAESFRGMLSGIMISGEEKMMKPDPAIYRLLCERFRLNAEETLFIDDNAENVKGAQNTGMRALCFDGDKEKLYSGMEAELL